jgi:excisionase family DNA binding protein
MPAFAETRVLPETAPVGPQPAPMRRSRFPPRLDALVGIPSVPVTDRGRLLRRRLLPLPTTPSNLSEFISGFGIELANPTVYSRGMRPSRSSLSVHRRSEAPRPTDKLAPDGAATIDGLVGNKRSASESPKLGSKILSRDIPPWAAADAFPGHRSSTSAREAPAQFDAGIGKARPLDAAVVKKRLSLNKQRVATGRASRLEPLLTAGEAGAILNVSVRTVRRLIASGVLPVVSIGRSVRVRPRDIDQMIAKGCACDD